MVGYRRPVERVLRIHADAPDRHARSVCCTRLLPLLCFLGSHARADVFPHRRVGRFEKALRRDQVFPLYAGGIRADAAWNSGVVLRVSIDRSAASGDSRGVWNWEYI